MANPDHKVISHSISAGLRMVCPAITCLLVAALSGCSGKEEAGEKAASSGPAAPERPFHPIPTVTPLIPGGIGSATWAVGEATASVTVDRTAGKGEFLFQRGDIQLEFGKGELPPDFPQDIPLPEGGKINYVVHGPGIATQVLVDVPMSYAEFRQNYLARLLQNGWTTGQEKRLPKGEGVSVDCSQGERKLTVTLQASGGGCFLTLAVPR